jgi:hypothetical protein
MLTGDSESPPRPRKTLFLSGFVDNYLRLTPPEELQFRSEIELLPLLSNKLALTYLCLQK